MRRRLAAHDPYATPASSQYQNPRTYTCYKGLAFVLRCIQNAVNAKISAQTAAPVQFGARSAPNCALATVWALILALTAFWMHRSTKAWQRRRFCRDDERRWAFLPARYDQLESVAESDRENEAADAFFSHFGHRRERRRSRLAWYGLRIVLARAGVAYIAPARRRLMANLGKFGRRGRPNCAYLP